MVVLPVSDVVLSESAHEVLGVSEFVGRTAELARLDALLAGDARLITLVGPGGIGKTRLAAEALRRISQDQRRPVYWARLAEVEREDRLADEDVVRSVMRTDGSDPSEWDLLLSTFTDAEASRERRILVLDNCEHVLRSVGRVITKLLATAPALTILATSREPIGWIDEYILTVPPLAPGQSLALLRQRAERTGRPIPDDPEQIEIAEKICRHVDHSPLFVRLAAARLRHQPPAMVLAELTGDVDDKRMRWSHGVRVGNERRHRGVYDVIAWSYDLCGPEERLLLERLSVFAAGYETDGADSLRNGIELADAVAVCADAILSPGAVEYLLERLAERSLLSTHQSAESVQWYLVESVRVFARDRLQRRDPAEAKRMADRHRCYYRDRVVVGADDWFGPRERAWVHWVRTAWDNILLAIDTGLDDPETAVVALETAAVLLATWIPSIRCGGWAVTRLTERALEAARTSSPEGIRHRVRASAMLAWNAIWQGRDDYAARLLDECVTLCRTGADTGVPWRETIGVDTGLPAPVEWTWGLELMLVRRDPRAIGVLDRGPPQVRGRGRSRRRGGQRHVPGPVSRCARFPGRGFGQFRALPGAFDELRIESGQGLGSDHAIGRAGQTRFRARSAGPDRRGARRSAARRRQLDGDLGGRRAHHRQDRTAARRAGAARSGRDGHRDRPHGGQFRGVRPDDGRCGCRAATGRRRIAAGHGGSVGGLRRGAAGCGWAGGVAGPAAVGAVGELVAGRT